MSAQEFRCFRIFYGLYLIFIFTALFSDRATAAALGPAVDMFCALGALSALIWATGFLRASAAFVIVISMAILLHLNSSYLRVIPGYISWMLIALSFVPKGEGRFSSASPGWLMPGDVQKSAVIVLGFTVFFSGVTKLMQTSWRSEDVLALMMSQARFRMDVLEQLGPIVRRVLSWLTIGSEILAPILLVFDRTRKIGWLGLATLFVGMLILMKIYVVIVGMILMLAFVYPISFRPRRKQGAS